jgi:GH35 family endo-1,4-beta-xylanase
MNTTTMILHGSLIGLLTLATQAAEPAAAPTLKKAYADGYDFEAADAFVDFGMNNGMYLVGHTLVWHSQTPLWVFQPAGQSAEASGAGSDDASRPRGRFGRGRATYEGPLASREELLERMRDHIRAVVDRAYEGVFRAFLKHRAAVEMVTFWGPNDANSGRRNGRPLLFDFDAKPKPAFDAAIRVAGDK